jgi:hypothetical protein
MRVSPSKFIFRLLLLPVAIAVIGLAVAACGGSSNSSDNGGGASHHTSKPHSTASNTATTTSAKTTTTAKTTASTTTPKKTTTTANTGTGSSNTGGAGLGGNGSLSECGVTDLSAKQLSSQGAAGTMVAVYALTNTGSSSCYTYGWPGIGFVTRDGQLLGTTPQRVTRDIAGKVGEPEKITLASGQEASFRITVAQVSAGGGGDCENASSLLITPPNSHPHLTLALGQAVAICGSATVTPMLTGTTASP